MSVRIEARGERKKEGSPMGQRIAEACGGVAIGARKVGGQERQQKQQGERERGAKVHHGLGRVVINHEAVQKERRERGTKTNGIIDRDEEIKR